LWRRVVTRIATEYPDVSLEHGYVDSCAMAIVTRPTSYDVILTENLFGDILSDEAAVLTGSLGMLPSASIGGKVGLYEPVHGSAPDIAGKGIANPLGAIASAAMLLRHSFNLDREAKALEAAIGETLNKGYGTADLKSQPLKVTTSEMGEIVRQNVKNLKLEV
jgi:3-isopropylmalate dehydrogenase